MLAWGTKQDEVEVDWARRLEWLVIYTGLMTVALIVLHLESVRLSPPTPARNHVSSSAQGFFVKGSK